MVAEKHGGLQFLPVVSPHSAALHDGHGGRLATGRTWQRRWRDAECGLSRSVEVHHVAQSGFDQCVAGLACQWLG